jgi:hypothetical protein
MLKEQNFRVLLISGWINVIQAARTTVLYLVPTRHHLLAFEQIFAADA